MKKTKKRLLTAIMLLVLGGLFQTLQAQESIYVEETDGTITQVLLSQVQKIDFSGTNMVLHKTDATILTWAITDVQKYYYGLPTSATQEIQAEVLNLVIYPNPSNGNFSINYKIEKASKVEITLIDISGKLIKVLLSEQQLQGTYNLQFQNTNLQKGLYFIRLKNGTNLTTTKIILN